MAALRGWQLLVTVLFAGFIGVIKGQLGAVHVVTRLTFCSFKWRKSPIMNTVPVVWSANGFAFFAMGISTRIVFNRQSASTALNFFLLWLGSSLDVFFLRERSCFRASRALSYLFCSNLCWVAQYRVVCHRSRPLVSVFCLWKEFQLGQYNYQPALSHPVPTSVCLL